MKRASTMWTTVARAPLAEREKRAKAVLRARRTSHNVSSRRLQSAPKARQEAAAKEHLAPLPGAGFRAPRGSPVGRREQRNSSLACPVQRDTSNPPRRSQMELIRGSRFPVSRALGPVRDSEGGTR